MNNTNDLFKLLIKTFKIKIENSPFKRDFEQKKSSTLYVPNNEIKLK